MVVLLPDIVQYHKQCVTINYRYKQFFKSINLNLIQTSAKGIHYRTSNP